MFFPSHLPIYHLDPPSHPPNWQQQQGGGDENHHQQQLPPPPPPIGGGGTGSIRPGSMSERAKLAKIPQPETALKCPRCESTNTKFCYFNNYNLSQPRHFCKTCRRYWTRGGALRSVPVGGGCRKNKRSSKRSRSKSPSMGQSTNSTSSTTSDLLGHNFPPPQHLPFYPPLHDFGNMDIGLNFCGIQSTRGGSGGGGNEIHELLQIGNNGTISAANNVTPLNLSARFADQWKLQQFPNFLSIMEQQPSSAYQFEGDQLNYVGGTSSDQLESKNTLEIEATQLALVKNKGDHNHHQEILQNNLSRNFSSVNLGNDHYWSGNTWADLSCSTSTAGHLI